MDEAEIRKVYRIERNRAGMAQIESDFFKEAARLLEREKRAQQKKMQAGATGENNYDNLRKLVDEIIDLREKKLVHRALAARRTGTLTGTGTAGKQTLPPEEKTAFEAVLAALQAHRQALKENIGEKQEEKPAETRQKPLNKVSIRIIKDVPAFIGADMNEYGPFTKGEEVSLPAATAELMTARRLGTPLS